jgi:hypothetical protein
MEAWIEIGNVDIGAEELTDQVGWAVVLFGKPPRHIARRDNGSNTRLTQ